MMNELGFLGITHITFGIILILAKKKERPDSILVAWLMMLIMPFLQQFINYDHPIGFIISRFNNQAFSLLYGPFLFLYIKEVTKQESRNIRYWPHFIVFIFFYLALVLQPAPRIPGGPEQGTAVQFSIFKYFGVFSLITFAFYAFFSFRHLKYHRDRVKETFAWQDSKITLFWLSLVPLLFISLLLVVILFEKSPLGLLIEIENLHLTVFLLFSLYLIFFGLRQKRVFPPPEKKEVKRTEISKKDSSLLLGKLESVMEEKKPYLNPKLSVYDLAKETDMTRHRISSLLNENLSINFFQYVNRYRLEEVCRCMKEDKEVRHNILELAFNSGFNSKSSFNSLFKTAYGQTPSQYRKSLQC